MTPKKKSQRIKTNTDVKICTPYRWAYYIDQLCHQRMSGFVAIEIAVSPITIVHVIFTFDKLQG
jgi:hypothetical protein